MPGMASVQTIVVTWNAHRWIQACLLSLSNSLHPTGITVVDNGSTDGTTDLVRKEFPDVKLIPQSTNLGFGPGNNIGISDALAAGSDFVFLLNMDAKVFPDTIGALVEAASSHEEYGILGPMQLDYEGNRIESVFSFFLYREGLADFFSDLYLKKTRAIYPIPFLPASAWLVSRRMLLTVGGFDPLFFPAYGEDDDLCTRAVHHGFKVGFAPGAAVQHYHGASFSENPSRPMSVRMRYLRIRGTKVLALKRPSGSFPLHYLALLRASFSESIQAGFYGDVKQLFAVILAATAVSVYLPKIYRHRKRSRLGCGAWLDIPREV